MASIGTPTVTGPNSFTVTVRGIGEIYNCGIYAYRNGATWDSKKFSGYPPSDSYTANFSNSNYTVDKVITIAIETSDTTGHYSTIIETHPTMKVPEPPTAPASISYGSSINSYSSNTIKFVFDKEQHRKLRDMLAGIKGKFLLSYNDDVFIRELYQNFILEEVSRSNNLAMQAGTNKMYNELIIRNYE